jgi:hypothetical protein
MDDMHQQARLDNIVSTPYIWGNVRHDMPQYDITKSQLKTPPC